MKVASVEAGPAGHVSQADLLRAAARDLAAAGIELPVLEARLLVGHVLGLSREALLAEPGRPVSAAGARALDGVVARRRLGEPLAYILGEREFWSLPFMVSPDVLIPRPDSEAIVETALSHIGNVCRSPRILDLGTGSGCLLLALLSECPSAFGIGLDRSPAALRVARANAARLGLAERCAFVCADWGSALADGGFDLVVANPPYVDGRSLLQLCPSVRGFEPEGALLGGTDGLDAYRALAPQLPRLLAPAGFAAVELGAGQRQPVADLLAAAGLATVAVSHDLAGRERCLVLQRN